MPHTAPPSGKVAMNEPTIEQMTNLRKLADYLSDLPDTYLAFDMETFFLHPEIDYQVEYDEMVASKLLSDIENIPCGSSACAVGHGPAAGIPPIPDDITWTDYCWRVFGIDSDGHDYDDMFGGEWYSRDNSFVGAANRIYDFLKKEYIVRLKIIADGGGSHVNLADMDQDEIRRRLNIGE